MVRAMHMKNRNVDVPYLQPHQMADYKFPAPGYEDGTTVEVNAGITATGLGVTNHLATVRGGKIIVPIFNLTLPDNKFFRNFTNYP